MKKLALVLSLLILALALTSVAAASSPEDGTFSITGYTNLETYEYRTLPSGKTQFDLDAAGTTAGYLVGTFEFKETGIVDYDPTTGDGSGRGTNQGTMTITTDQGEVVVKFRGQTDSVSVWGTFTVVEGFGSYANLHGQGRYTGEAGLGPFTVVFTGRFHNAPR